MAKRFLKQGFRQRGGRGGRVYEEYVPMNSHAHLLGFCTERSREGNVYQFVISEY